MFVKWLNDMEACEPMAVHIPKSSEEVKKAGSKPSDWVIDVRARESKDYHVPNLIEDASTTNDYLAEILGILRGLTNEANSHEMGPICKCGKFLNLVKSKDKLTSCRCGLAPSVPPLRSER